MKRPGDDLLELCSRARTELLLVAPFMKSAVVRRMLESTGPTVHVRCVTRWRPEEVRAGVTDLEVLDVLGERSASLFLRADLHAKYYRGDSRILVGSANLTAAGLGWREPANFELLEDLTASTEWRYEFESNLLLGCVRAEPDIQRAVQAAADALVGGIVIDAADASPAFPSLENAVQPHRWLPALRNPEELFALYSGRDDELSVAGRDAARRDLAFLKVPRALDPSQFITYVAAALLQTPFLRELDVLALQPRRFGEIRDLICSRFAVESDEADRAWQTLMRWLLYFLGDRYRRTVPRHSEVFVRKTS